jgi:hypothetical protein
MAVYGVGPGNGLGQNPFAPAFTGAQQGPVQQPQQPQQQSQQVPASAFMQAQPNGASPSGIGGGGGLLGAAQQQANVTGIAPANSVLDALAGSQVQVTAYQGGSLTTQLVDAQEYAKEFYTWSPQQQNDLRAQLGLVNTSYLTATSDQIATAWFDYIRQAAQSTANGRPISPSDLISSDIASGNGGKGKGNTTLTRNISTTQLTSAPDSNAIFQAASTALLGRAPTADEAKAFQANLNSSERANPINQTIQYEYNPAGYVVDKSVLKSAGGETDAAKQNIAMQQLRGTTEYANYQASTTYMGALQQLLQGGTV